MIRRPPRSPLFPSTPLFRPTGGSVDAVDPPLPFPLGEQRPPVSQHSNITRSLSGHSGTPVMPSPPLLGVGLAVVQDRKSTRLNSSHANISYAVFCLKKKKLH